VRKVTAYSRGTGDADQENPHIEFHEVIPLSNPGTVPEDCIHWNAMSMTNYSASKKDWIWQDTDGGSPGSFGESAGRPIMVFRMRGSTVPITVLEGTSVGYDPVDQHECRPFNHYDDWPAWPENDRGQSWDEDPSTHCYRYFWQKYAAHCSVLHLKWKDYEHQQDVKRTKIMLYGMYDASAAANVNNVLPLAKSWEYAPSMSVASAGFSGGSYDKTERAYRLSRDLETAGELSVTLSGSANSPVYNPCLVIANWNAEVDLSVNGVPVPSGSGFRQGIEGSADGTESLVVWLRTESTSPVQITLSEKAAADIDGDGDVDRADLSLLAADWLERAGYQPLAADLNGDGTVNFDDYAILAGEME
jgi:hypothetical protein